MTDEASVVAPRRAPDAGARVLVVAAEHALDRGGRVVARARRPVADEPHHARVAVEGRDVVDVVAHERSQRQALRAGGVPDAAGRRGRRRIRHRAIIPPDCRGRGVHR
ncbi:MAG: hypothetical protein KJ018_00205 [Burkholderiales bacterium]|nr:hypothetical protein [Burkholderiales bacterium]